MKPSTQASNIQNNTKVLTSSKHVRFSNDSFLVFTPPKSSKDRKLSWYSKADYDDFKRNNYKSVRSILTRSPDAAKEYITKTFLSHDSTRFVGVEYVCGIEHGLSPEVGRALCTAKSNVRKGVLQEQARQRKFGVTNAERIAAVSKRASAFPKLWRQRVAVLNFKY